MVFKLTNTLTFGSCFTGMLLLASSFNPSQAFVITQGGAAGGNPGDNQTNDNQFLYTVSGLKLNDSFDLTWNLNINNFPKLDATAKVKVSGLTSTQLKLDITLNNTTNAANNPTGLTAPLTVFGFGINGFSAASFSGSVTSISGNDSNYPVFANYGEGSIAGGIPTNVCFKNTVSGGNPCRNDQKGLAIGKTETFVATINRSSGTFDTVNGITLSNFVAKIQTNAENLIPCSSTLCPSGNASLELSAVPSETTKTLLKLFEVEGRVGVLGRADYEFAIGPEGANELNTGVIYDDWEDGVAQPWSLTYDPTTAQAAFTVGSQTITNTNVNVGEIFNAFKMIAYSKEKAGVVEAGTSVNFIIDTINGSSLTTPYSVSAIAGTTPFIEYDSPIFTSQILSMSGTTTIDWLGTVDPRKRGRSRVGFKLKAYDPPITSPIDVDAVKTPEPTVILGLLMSSFFGFLSWRKS